MEVSRSASFAQRFFNLVATQATANFAMVMSTGIVSVALNLLGYTASAWALFFINLVMFVSLMVLYPLRLIMYPHNFLNDFADHNKGPGYLTLVAGTCILGNQCALLAHDPLGAQWLFWAGVVGWVIILWGVFLCIFTRNPKPPVEHGINGAWLVATVSTQAIVILGSIIIESTSWDKETGFFALTTLFVLGFMLYILVITMIVYRFCYKELEPEQFSPTYWINAGAVAITTLAGSELIVRAQDSTLLTTLLPFLKGLTLMAWAMASWWIGMLFLLFWWRHGLRKYPFTYTAEYWGMVFPLGMYTACTIMLSKALDVPFLMVLPRAFIYVACIAWLATFTGMLLATGRALWGKRINTP